ncbi:hypothetical protein QIS74_07615 [Colletotrichum tabaci]|uniref:Uncharacterized protein n=1 Tax=Colletotrichum tabaci TaxID=1209068 RepID=A0AAV9TBT5_9PEZI
MSDEMGMMYRYCRPRCKLKLRRLWGHGKRDLGAAFHPPPLQQRYNPIKMPASQIASPLPIPPQRRNLRLMTGQDLYASLNASLASTTHRPVTPVHMIQENDYSVPAPPPPSPVSFAAEHWQSSIRR